MLKQHCISLVRGNQLLAYTWTCWPKMGGRTLSKQKKAVLNPEHNLQNKERAGCCLYYFMKKCLERSAHVFSSESIPPTETPPWKCVFNVFFLTSVFPEEMTSLTPNTSQREHKKCTAWISSVTWPVHTQGPQEECGWVGVYRIGSSRLNSHFPCTGLTSYHQLQVPLPSGCKMWGLAHFYVYLHTQSDWSSFCAAQIQNMRWRSRGLGDRGVKFLAKPVC